MNSKFDKIFLSRSFFFHYIGHGLEEGEFAEAKENIEALERDYQELGQDTEAEGDEGGPEPEMS